MSLIKCNECGKEISDKAESCPNCGYTDKSTTVKTSTQMRTGSIISLIANIIILLIALCLAVSSVLPANPNSSSTTTTTVAFTYFAFEVICIIASLYCTVFLIMYLCNKIKNIKIYRICVLLASIIELIMSVLAIYGFGCCGMFFAIFPLINLIGAIIVATGRAK